VHVYLSREKKGMSAILQRLAVVLYGALPMPSLGTLSKHGHHSQDSGLFMLV
jgi:hypothetical protein